MDNSKRYIEDWFINLSLDKIPPSFFVIRQSLLKSVDGLKPIIKGKILDLGCGVMPYKDYLKNSNIEKYIGVDINNSFYHNLVDPDLFWDGINIPIEDSSCDFVIATEFLEHYLDTPYILLEINRVLKKGGILFFTVPAIWPIHEAPFDYHRFTPFVLYDLFEKSKFSSWIVKPLGGFNVCLALMLSFWFEKKASNILKKITKPILFKFIKFLLKRDKINISFENGEFYSGLYGFVTK